jgi:hypothetical protein
MKRWQIICGITIILIIVCIAGYYLIRKSTTITEDFQQSPMLATTLFTEIRTNKSLIYNIAEKFKSYCLTDTVNQYLITTQYGSVANPSWYTSPNLKYVLDFGIAKK